MWVLGTVNRWFMLRGLPLLSDIPALRDLPLVHGYFWVRDVRIPSADQQRLRDAVNRETVAFLGPNHPEFATDWLVDKEISTMVAPRMASWADRGIVAMAPGFWGMNNLVSNDGGEAAKEYSVAWALDGEGVLLHPEGTVRWTNDYVHPLFPGIAQMAMKAAQRTEKPVFIVPLVWKYQYVRDVGIRMHREMRIIETALGLPSGDGEGVPRRFQSLQRNILVKQMRRYGLTEAAVNEQFFERQSEFQQHLVRKLEQRYPTEPSDSIDKRIARIARAIRTQRAELNRNLPSFTAQRELFRRDAEMADEAKRLGEFTREIYGMPTLSQEQISESLKRTRDRMLNRGWKDAVAKMAPRPFGPRTLHVGVPEPIRVSHVDPKQHAEYENVLMELTRKVMQETVDEINRRIEPDVAPFRCANPFVVVSAATNPPPVDRY